MHSSVYSSPLASTLHETSSLTSTARLAVTHELQELQLEVWQLNTGTDGWEAKPIAYCSAVQQIREALESAWRQ